MNTTIHFINDPLIFTDIVTTSRLCAGGLYIVDIVEEIVEGETPPVDAAMLYFATSPTNYKTIAGGGGGSGGGAQWGGEEW